jgi:hypothetical protein
MRIRFTEALAVLAVLALAAPAFAREKSVDLDVRTPTMIGTTQLKPGHYQLEAKESGSQLTVVRNGKEVAEVPCHWVQLDKKADNSEVLINSNQITEVEFGGSAQAVKI